MGKIRVKAVGEEQSTAEKQKKDEKKQQKRLEKAAAKKTEAATTPVIEAPEAKVSAEEAPKKSKKEKFAKKGAEVSPRVKSNLSLLKKDSVYPLAKAVELLKTFKKAKFDETVELHINVKEKGINGQVNLPHGTGKKLRIKIADEALIAQVEKGVIDFDILVAHPTIMAKLAKVARILGPRGLMPNPKAGTISPKPEEAVEKLSAGQVNYKTEAQASIIHMSIGKASFTEKQLEENIKMAYSVLPEGQVMDITLKSTMSPGVKLDLKTLV